MSPRARYWRAFLWNEAPALPDEGRCGPTAARRSSRDIFRSGGWNTCIYGGDQKETRSSILALPFCHIRRTAQRPPDPAYPKSLTTIGDHIKKRRLDLGLFQKQVSTQIGADEMTVCNWELRLTEPEVRFIPRIIEFLVYYIVKLVADS